MGRQLCDDLILAARQLDVEVDLNPIKWRRAEGAQRLGESQRRAARGVVPVMGDQ